MLTHSLTRRPANMLAGSDRSASVTARPAQYRAT